MTISGFAKTIKSAQTSNIRTNAATDKMVSHISSKATIDRPASINFLRNRVKQYNKEIDAVDPSSGLSKHNQEKRDRLTASRDIVYRCLKMFQAAYDTKDSEGVTAARNFALRNGIELQDDTSSMTGKSSLKATQHASADPMLTRPSGYVRTPGSELRRGAAMEKVERGLEQGNADMDAVLAARKKTQA